MMRDSTAALSIPCLLSIQSLHQSTNTSAQWLFPFVSYLYLLFQSRYTHQKLKDSSNTFFNDFSQTNWYASTRSIISPRIIIRLRNLKSSPVRCNFLLKVPYIPFRFFSLLYLTFYFDELVGAFKPMDYSIVITTYFSNQSCIASVNIPDWHRKKRDIVVISSTLSPIQIYTL